MSLIECSHCNQFYNKESLFTEKFNDQLLYFCCNGCQGVYHILYDSGLDDFYEKLGKNKLTPPTNSQENTDYFDMEDFTKRYISITDDGFSKINLIIEGIHCAACVWLNEKVLYELEGMIDVNINFTNNKAKIIWDNQYLKLSTIIKKIRNIGYNAYPYEQNLLQQNAKKNNQSYFLKMNIAIFASINIMMISLAKYSGLFLDMTDSILQIIHFAEFIFTTPVLFYSGSIFYRGAYYGIKNKILNMDFLVITGATLTYLYSFYIFLGNQGHIYFDSVVMIITFVLIGKYLELKGRIIAADTMDIIKASLPKEATVVKLGTKTRVSIDSIQVGDIIEVKDGEKASVDGVLLNGVTSFDESNITGESSLVHKKIDDPIYSGTFNTENTIQYKATTNYVNSTTYRIVELLEEALNSKPQIEQTTNIISKYFSILILLLSIISFLGWYIYNQNFEHALMVTISIIVIACPCALALATPIASIVGMSWLASKGIIFKKAKYIETLSNINMVIFDKTGTLTEGKLKIIHKSIDTNYIELLYALVDSSNHLISKSIKTFLQETYPLEKNIFLNNIKQIPAIGMETYFKNQKIFAGKDSTSENTSFILRVDGDIKAKFLFEDTLKKDAKRCIDYLYDCNIRVAICSGDHPKVVEKIAQKLNIKEYYGHMNPLDKANFVQSNSKVVMVGDGLNDALALANAEISIAMGNSADVSLNVSDIVILNNSLEDIMMSFKIAKRTFYFIKQNLIISLIYNIITIPIAIFGYVIPLIAALSMSLSSLIVIGNSILRIKKVKI